MQKTFFVSIVSLGFLLISSICAYILRYVTFENAWIPLIIGFGFFLINIAVAIIAENHYRINYVSFAINAIGLGFCIRSWYIFRNFDNSILIMLVVSVIASLYLWVFHMYSKLPFFDRHPTLSTIIFLIFTLVSYTFVVAETRTTFVSTIGFYLIIEVAFLFAMGVRVDTYKELFRNVLLSSFSVIAVAIIIAIIMLGGDDLDLDLSGLNFSNSSNEKKKKK